MAAQNDQQDQTQASEGETTEGSDKPPHEDPAPSHTASHPSQSTMTNGSGWTIPLPPPEAGTYDKEPGHTIGSLKKLVTTGIPPGGYLKSADKAPQPQSATTPNGRHTGSTPTSPSGSSSDERQSDSESAPSTRPPTQPPSRAPSVSGGKSGDGKVAITRKDFADTAPGTPTSASSKKRSFSGGFNLPTFALKPASTPNTPAVETPVPASASTAATLRPKPASVHSHDDKDKHKFNLKDLLAATPKLSRKSSQRSTGSRSSRKSDTDRESAAGGPYASGPRSAAGESTTSLTKKYGVCQKVAIGKGATSVVRLAHKWDRTEEKLYAVKEFRKRRKNESEKEYVKKLTSEFCISSTLHHVNIVETVDLVQDENQKWCEVMEFCPGGDLYAAIRKGGMSPSEVECCFKQILNGVQYLHSQGVAHRDIKPENLFFDTKGHLKIGDYGASTVYRLPWEATIHMSTGLCGSEPYIAPEQFLGKPYDARLVDIWACGIVYYCLHFQELPWRVAQPTDNLYQSYVTACSSSSQTLSSCPPTINNLSPRPCRSLIRRMLEPDPKGRATIEEVIKHSWVESIEVCHEVAKPSHIHVHAQALAQAQLKEVH